jgi:UDP-N-acetylmuramoyl-tripeptide--D-alanyl-D-alanine ligase
VAARTGGIMLLQLPILTLFVFFFLIRWLRWLAIVQQKEYRWDRLNIFIRTPKGKKALTQILPDVKNFTLSRLKRPVQTIRIIVVALISLGLSAAWVVWLFTGGFGFLFLLGLVFWLIFIPMVVYISLIPTQLVFWSVSQYYQQQAKNKISQAKPTVIGITGSYGKTTTKVLLANVLQQKFNVFATKKSFNTRYSFPKDIYQRYQGEEMAILEYAAYRPGEIKYLADLIPPQFSVITGLADQHLALFRSRENIVRAKSELVAAQDLSKPVFVNGADQGAIKIAQAGGAKEIIDYSGEEAQVEVSQIKLNQKGQLSFVWNEQKIQTKLVGTHYLQAIKAAIAVGQYLNMSKSEIVQGLSEFEPPSYFITSQLSTQGFTAIDDGRTSNPVGFKAAIELTKQLKENYDWVGLLSSGIVDLGSKSAVTHQQLAEQAKDVFDEVWYVGKPGLSQFEEQFGDQFYTREDQIRSRIDQVDKNGILLIEGRIPLSLRKYLAI